MAGQSFQIGDNTMKFEKLADSIKNINDKAGSTAKSAVNQLMSLRNWAIGYYIVEYEQAGSDRAEYGTQLLKNLEKEISQKEALIRNYYGDISKKEKKKVEEPLVTVEIPTPVEISEPQQVVREIEKPKPIEKVSFLNRFMNKLGEFVDGVE